MSSQSSKKACAASLAFTLLLCGFAANPASAAAEQGNCTALSTNAPPGAQITSAMLQPPGPFALPPELGPGRTVQLPAFCRVQGVLRPTPDSNIVFEAWLPASGWNGRFLGVGNGGYAGSVGYSSLATAVQNGYAAASTDTGHGVGAAGASWASGHPEKVVDFGWRAVHLTTVAGKALTAAFYGAPPRHSYFESCSNGGRQALMEAQRFPEDYDGIMAGAPAYNWTALFTDFVWNAQALGKPGAMIPASKTPAIAREVLAQCDAQDGLADGLVSDPLQCRVDLKKLRCADKESAACLTDPQLTALASIHQ